MTGLLKKALTHKIARKGSRGKQQIIVIPPSEKLALGVKFAMAMTACLSAVETAHIAFLGERKSEIFAAATGLAGTVSGIPISTRALTYLDPNIEVMLKGGRG
jgi:hypothetical protein